MELLEVSLSLIKAVSALIGYNKHVKIPRLNGKMVTPEGINSKENKNINYSVNL